MKIFIKITKRFYFQIVCGSNAEMGQHEPHQTEIVLYRLQPLFPTHNYLFDKSKNNNLLTIRNYKTQIHQWSIVSS